MSPAAERLAAIGIAFGTVLFVSILALLNSAARAGASVDAGGPGGGIHAVLVLLCVILGMLIVGLVCLVLLGTFGRWLKQSVHGRGKQLSSAHQGRTSRRG